jgi:RNA polymerase sigma factor (sigma-70 family)
MGRSDADLVAAARRGERAAFGALVERYQSVVCAVTYSRTGDRALSEDVAQDTFLAAWSQLDKLRDVGRLRAWLCGIARNLAGKARRRSARETVVDQVVAASSDMTPFDQVSEAQSERLVRDALARVPETYREVMVLYYRDNRSLREVAATLGLTEAAALQRLSRGRAHLADGLTRLVERSLRSQHVQRNLVAGVLAGLAALAPSHAAATPNSSGGSMIKLAVAAATVLAAGTATYATLSPSTAPSMRPPAASTAVVAAARAESTSPPPVTATAPTPASPPAGTLSAPSALASPAPEPLPRIDAGTIARLGLHQGPSRGPADAAVTIAVFNDMQCRYCGDALGSLDQLLEEFPSQLRIVVKQMPVRQTSMLAAEAALAADAQGRFWELHDLMMANQDDLSREVLLALARQADLDVPALRDALDQRTFAAAVALDLASASELHIQGTPAFVINGQPITGNQPIEILRTVVEQALANRSPRMH